MSMKVLEIIRVLQDKKMAFVPFADVCKFLQLCEVLGVVACGGAFATDMSGQWFYL